MSGPKGKLTPAQYEILEAVWAAGPDGATVAAIWEAVSVRREVGRTTILNLVDRLEKRGWLSRRKEASVFRYLAAVERDATARVMAGEFLDEFFGGSADQLILSLLGSKRLRPEDLERIRRLLDQADREPQQPEGKS